MTRTLAHPVAHVCRVCGRPAQLDDLCRRHGGSYGLIIQTEDLPRSLRIGLRAMVTGAVLTLFLGVLTLALGGSLTGRDDASGAARLLSLVMIGVALVTVVVAMYLSELRAWAWPLSLVLVLAVGAASIVILLASSPSSSYRTLVIVLTTLPYLLAGVLIAVWRSQLPPDQVGRRAGGEADAPSPA